MTSGPPPTAQWVDVPHHASPAAERARNATLEPALLAKALPDALRKLDPRTLWRNPVMFIVEIGVVGE